MDYEALQSAVVDRLSALNGESITVVGLPENEAERTKPLPTKVKMTVIYAGSDYDPVASTAQIKQDEKIYIAVLIESSFLYGALGIYSLVSLIKKMLIGFQPAGCRRFRMSKHHTIGEPDAVKKDNMWQYQVIFMTDTVTVEDFTEDVSVLVKKILLIEVPGGDTTVVPPE